MGFQRYLTSVLTAVGLSLPVKMIGTLKGCNVTAGPGNRLSMSDFTDQYFTAQSRNQV